MNSEVIITNTVEMLLDSVSKLQGETLRQRAYISELETRISNADRLVDDLAHSLSNALNHNEKLQNDLAEKIMKEDMETLKLLSKQ